MDGIQKFVEPFDALMEGIELAREGVVTGRPPTIKLVDPGRARAGDREAGRAGARPRTWSSASGARTSRSGAAPACPRSANRLGWLTISEKMLDHADELREFVESVKADGFTDVALLGMGGSSLGPEVIRRSFGEIPGGLRLHVLDSTDPAAVLGARALGGPGAHAVRRLVQVGRHDRDALPHALLPRAQRRRRQPLRGGHRPGQPAGGHGEASSGFRRVFENDPNIGGRYSVLSYFGLVPAALAGVSVEALLGAAQVAEQNCASSGDTSANSGLWLGVVMGELALQGRDKLTFVVSPADRELRPLGRAARGGVHRQAGQGHPAGGGRAARRRRRPTATTALFVYLRNADEPDEELDSEVRGARPRRPPDASRSRCTARPTSAGSSSSPSSRPPWPAGCSASTRSTSPTSRRPRTTPPRCSRAATCPRWTRATSRELLKAAEPPHYVAILGFAAPSEEIDAAVAELRSAIRDATKATTTFGYGPRYLHSTGQFHKGGPPAGPVPASSCTTATEDVRDPGRRLRVRAPEERPGDRRPADAARPRPAPPCRCGSRGRRAGGPRPDRGE